MLPSNTHSAFGGGEGGGGYIGTLERSGLIPKSQWNVIMAQLLRNHQVETLQLNNRRVGMSFFI